MMHRIGDTVSRNTSKSSTSNLEENMHHIQSNLKMIYSDDENVHLGNYNVNAVSGYHSNLDQDRYDSHRHHFTSQQSNDVLLDEKNKQIRNLNKELAELRQQQQVSQFEQFENYQKMIENLKKENHLLQQKRLSNEAHSHVNTTRVAEQEQLIIDLQSQVEEMQIELEQQRVIIKDQQESIRNLQGKLSLAKHDSHQKNQAINDIQKESESHQITLRQENHQLKQIIEDLQQDMDKESRNAYPDLLSGVLDTIAQFILQFEQQSKIKLSTDLTKYMQQFSYLNENSFVQKIELMSSLVIALFEQINLDSVKNNHDQNKMTQMKQQIHSLEEMTINLEYSLGQYEAVSKEQAKFIQEASNKTKVEKEELVTVLLNKTHNEQQFQSMDKVIRNLEDSNVGLQNDLKQTKDKVASQSEQINLLKKLSMEDNMKSKILENKLKRQHSDGLFLRELLHKLIQIIGNETTSKNIDQILELQSKTLQQQADEIEIRCQLEQKEQNLKAEIKENLNLNEMLDKRREIELLRNQLRNCQKQLDMNREKIEMLVRDIDSFVMESKCEQFSTVYFKSKY